MKRNLTLSRLYSLGDFKNIQFTDTIEDIPEDIALNPKAINLLRSIQLFQVEKSFLKYMQMMKAMNGNPREESLELVDELHETASRKFIELFQDIPMDLESQREDEEEITDENARNAG